MNFQHQKMASGAWRKMSLAEKMANVGSEVYRSLSWREKGNTEYAKAAFLRSLELFDLTLQSEKPPKLKEIARARELWVDYFINGNTYNSKPDFFKKYFSQFNFLARK